MTRDRQRRRGLRRVAPITAPAILVLFAVFMTALTPVAHAGTVASPSTQDQPETESARFKRERAERIRLREQEKQQREEERLRLEREEKQRLRLEHEQQLKERARGALDPAWRRSQEYQRGEEDTIARRRERQQRERESRDREAQRTDEQRKERRERMDRRTSGRIPPRIDRGPKDGKKRSRRAPHADKDFKKRNRPSDALRPKLPKQLWDGRSHSHRHQRTAPGFTRAIANEWILEKLRDITPGETDVDHYYWHYDDGIDWSHITDASGNQWYGWYFDDHFFWTLTQDGRWWWYDQDHRWWTYWHEGYWWYWSEDDVYVAIDDIYYLYKEEKTSFVLQPEKGEHADELEYLDKDGYRLVQIVGTRKEAFLFDLQPDDQSFQPSFLTFLGEGVEEVRYVSTADWLTKEQSLRIITIHTDGVVRLFDSDGFFLRSKRFREFGRSIDPVALILREPMRGSDPEKKKKMTVLQNKLQGLRSMNLGDTGSGSFDGR